MGFCKEVSPKEALHSAARDGRLSDVERLLGEGMSANYANKEHGETPLYVAALRGNLAIAKVLLRHGADLESRAKDGGRTPLHVAAQYGHADMASLLLCRGAEEAAETRAAFRPLSCSRLVPAGATALDLARLSETSGVAELLASGAWRRERRRAFAVLRALREQDRAYPNEPQELEAAWMDRLLTLRGQIGPHTSEGILRHVFAFAGW